MCVPIVAAAAVVAATTAAAGAGAQVAGSIKAGNAARRQGEAEAAQAEQNAFLADMAATQALMQGEKGVAKIRAEGSALKSAQRVGYATAGVDASSGTAGETQAETDVLTSIDEETLRTNAWRDAWGYRTQGLNYRRQADLDREAGKQAQAGSYLSALGAGLSGVAGAVGSTYRIGRT